MDATMMSIRGNGVMKEESHKTVAPDMIGEEDLHDDPGVSDMKEEVLSDVITDVGDTSVCHGNNDKFNEAVETEEISTKRHVLFWSDLGVQNVEITEKKLFSDREEVQSDLPITEVAPKYSDILKQEFVDPEFVCMDGLEAWHETNKMCVDPLAGADDKKPYGTTSKHELQECPNDQHSADTCSIQSGSRNIVFSPLAADCNQKKPCNSSTLNIDISREQSLGTVTEHLSGPPITHQCETCGRIFKTRELLLTHEKSHWKKCEKCGRRFKTNSRLLVHLKRGCSPLVPMKCDACGKTFMHRSYLTAHKKHDCGRQEPHKCEACGKTFNYRSHLLSHKKYDCGRQEPHKCESCGKTYKGRSSLWHHMKYSCGRHEPHKCELCGKTYKDRDCLMKHMKYDCGRVEPHKCESCGKTFKSKTCLRRHVLYDCGRQEPHKCESCGKMFKIKNSLRRHILYDCGYDCGREKPHKCHSCGKTYKLIHSLWRHLKLYCVVQESDKNPDEKQQYYTNTKHELLKCPDDQHSGDTCSTQSRSRNIVNSPMADDCNQQQLYSSSAQNSNISREHSPDTVADHLPDLHTPHQCETCGRAFMTSRLLSTHVKSHWNKCEKCGQRFKTRSRLLTHIKHGCSPLVPLKCDSCGKTFNHRTHFTAHKKHDCGRREPHKCESCGKTYKCIATLRRHTKHDCGRVEPHNCESCGRPFKSVVCLRKHIKHDCGRSEPHNCESCGKPYKCMASLRRHLKSGCGHQEIHKSNQVVTHANVQTL